MHRFIGKSNENATKIYLNVKQETFDNVSTVACLGEELPSLLSDDEFGAAPLTIVKSEVTDVLGTKQELEVSIVSGQPAKFPELNEMVPSMPQPALKYGCPKCSKTFDNKIDRMLHEQIHSFQDIPRIADISGFKCIDLCAYERRERRTIYEQGDETHQTGVQENNSAEEDGSEMEKEFLIMHNATLDNTEDFGDMHHSVWDADSESKSSICDESSDEECSENDVKSSNESKEITSNVGITEEVSNTKSRNASAKHQRKPSLNAKEDEASGSAVIKKRRNEITKRDPTLNVCGKFTCSYCARRFKMSGNLKTHLMTHTGDKPHKCDVCGKGFITKTHCLAHKMTHTGERPYKCADCEKTFIRKGNYVKHSKLHSSKYDLPHCCHFCGKKVSESRNLKYHILLHKGPKPYRCLMCKKNISSSDKWKRHIEKNHKEEYEDVAELRRREKRKPCKRPHECRTCGKFFCAPSALELHQRIHTGEQPYHCKFCDRRFSVINSLNRHLLTHSGIKPYMCIVCKIPFSTKDEMVSHREITHENEERSNKATPAGVDPSTQMTDDGISGMNDVDRTSKDPEADHGVCSSANKGLDAGQKSVEKKKKRRHFPSENESELSVSISHALPKKSRKRGSDLSDHVLTETQDQPSIVFADVDNPPSVLQEYAIPLPPNENIGDHLTVDRHSQRIRFKRSSIECIVEKNAEKHPNTFHLVWSKNFSADLAAAVASNASNCILCVKKFDPSALPDVWSLLPNFSLQTATVHFGSVSQPVHFFNFGDMNLPLSRRSFKSYKKIESSLKKFVRLEGMELKNVIKYSKKENSWYNVLMQQLKGDCIVTNKV